MRSPSHARIDADDGAAGQTRLVVQRRSRARRKLPRDWAHPIGRDRIQRALAERGVRVDRLVLAMPPLGARPLLLIRVRRFTDLSVEGKRHAEHEDRSTSDPVTLWIPALPRDRLAAGRAAIDAGALDSALQWIVDARARGNAWQATERLWTAHLVDGAVVVAEHQRQSRGSSLGSTGLEDR